jgi:hypothetical protein
MSHENKHNVHYFEASSMRELFHSIETWQNENNQRFLSLNTEKDKEKFCCITLTNPTEVVICNGFGDDQARVTRIREYGYPGLVVVQEVR